MRVAGSESLNHASGQKQRPCFYGISTCILVAALRVGKALRRWRRDRCMVLAVCVTSRRRLRAKFIPLFPLDTLPNISALNVDLFGIARGRCKEVGCDCERYTVLASANVRCDYCDHCPGSHGRLDELGKWFFFIVLFSLFSV